MKLNFSSLILFVHSVERLKSFYVDILKLEILEEIPSEWLLLDAGNCSIGLHKIGEQYAADINTTPKFENNTKIVFDIDEDINSLREILLLQQVTLREIKTFPNYPYWLCDGEDPEGNVFQLKRKKE